MAWVYKARAFRVFVIFHYCIILVGTLGLKLFISYPIVLGGGVGD